MDKIIRCIRKGFKQELENYEGNPRKLNVRSELAEEIEELSNEIYSNANDYILDFIAENQTYSF